MANTDRDPHLLVIVQWHNGVPIFQAPAAHIERVINELRKTFRLRDPLRLADTVMSARYPRECRLFAREKLRAMKDNARDARVIGPDMPADDVLDAACIGLAHKPTCLAGMMAGVHYKAPDAFDDPCTKNWPPARADSAAG